MDFHIGSAITDKNGEQIGKLRHVIVHPETNEVVEVVLGESGLLGRDVVVPIAVVNSAQEEGIQLAMTKDEAKGLKDFVTENYVAPPPQLFAQYPWAGAALVGQGLAPVGAATGIESLGLTPIVETHEQIARGDVDIAKGTEVWATDGKIGTVRDVVVDEQTRRVRGLVVQEGIIFHKDVEISVDLVAGIGSDRVTLRVGKSEIPTE